ncbi:hypothetical protein GOBAR_DD22303 [Gossypium barbadense]|nr:hypothetical protein GOBAR_DD22303 [Gossypium barbadense]
MEEVPSEVEAIVVNDQRRALERSGRLFKGQYSDGRNPRALMIVVDVEDREAIGGSAFGGQRAVCCTADLAKLGVCPEGEMIHRPSTKNPGWPKVFGISFSEDDEVTTLPLKSIQITKTGMYNLYFIHCDLNLKDLIVEGKTVWKNPTGYLSGRMAPLMNFYGFMSLVFVILGIFWFMQYARFWREFLPLQNFITLVITLGMLEMALWYFDYAEFNGSGTRPIGITMYAYSGEANEDFDKDDTNLTLIKPSPTPSKDFRTVPETRTAQGSNGASSNGDLEEDKTE